MIIFIYAILVFLVLRFSVTLFNFLSNPKLNRYGRRFSDLVSVILLPNPDEDITALIRSIDKQDYKDLELIIKSEDEDDQMTIARANGKYLLFLDPDMEISDGLLNNLIHRTKVFNLSLLNVIPTQKPGPVTTWFAVPLREFLVLNMYPLRLMRLINSPAFSVGHTGCMFFTTDDYRSGKSRDRMETLLANGLVVASPSRFNVEGRQLLQVFANSGFAAIIYLILAMAGPVAMFIYLDPSFLALPVGLIFLSRIMVSFLTNQNPLINILLHPLQMMVLTWLLMREVWIKMRQF